MEEKCEKILEKKLRMYVCVLRDDMQKKTGGRSLRKPSCLYQSVYGGVQGGELKSDGGNFLSLDSDMKL